MDIIKGSATPTVGVESSCEEDDYERVNQGDEWKIGGVREAITADEQALTANSNDGVEIKLDIKLSPREREVLLTGGTLKFLRNE